MMLRVMPMLRRLQVLLQFTVSLVMQMVRVLYIGGVLFSGAAGVDDGEDGGPVCGRSLGLV